MENTVVIGLGNPILSDDSVGIKAARLLKPRLEDFEHVVVKELYGGGLVLMEAMAGFKRAVVVDAMVTRKHAPGTIQILGMDDFKCSRNLACGHDTGLADALEVGRSVGLNIPSDVMVIAIEAVDVINFGENLSAPVADALIEVVEMVVREVLPVEHSVTDGR